MTPLTERALELFGELCDLAEPTQALRLEEIGRADPELRAAVAELLRGDRLPDGGLDQPVLVQEELLAAFAAPDGDPLAPRLAPGLLRSGQDLIGRRLGPFTLVRCLGTGRSGVVLEAEQDQPRRRVALKVLRRGLTSAEALQRFQHEAAGLRRLRHPSIAEVYRAGTVALGVEVVPYFATELVREAHTLDEHLRAIDPDLAACVALLLQVCDAIHHGHERGVLHLRLDPSCVLVGRDGVPKVIDLGVARATEADGAPALPACGGTLEYRSPELRDPSRGPADQRSDVYSLGALLQALARNRPPGGGDGDAHLREELEAVSRAAMAADRRRRPRSARVLREELERRLRDVASGPWGARLGRAIRRMRPPSR